MVRSRVSLFWKYFGYSINRIVAATIVRSLRPIEYGPQSLEDATGGLRLGHPNRVHCAKYVCRVNCTNLLFTKHREYVLLKSGDPLLAVFRIRPRAFMHRVHLLRRRLERRCSTLG